MLQNYVTTCLVINPDVYMFELHTVHVKRDFTNFLYLNTFLI